ncbi:lysozyme inhibitor LprI family protein [Paraburkholderia aspalathi]|jgi:uncharacterized protein YecT (DUF1311 family)|uniref:lysozyme inhibitor LprI family protein n=1 Tax=Paraburkholderia aspalathi TaxID=1324617 RepID=UPI00190B953E|nr:lysozyme inhibitor LprI family protein [Paraburkholderia aspalathi]MBK3841666.1 DUF1311 domain-containing protein [Paraburkholderia aspalathi]CAE6793344.1 hypothetical protein R20943_04871 [Paraburkholderia aspalathi]CAE6810655.1 hypothetical protein R69746_05604 [Paraburkholderia aspalathi]
MIKRIFIMFAIFVFSSIAAASTLCNSKITRELEACARNNFELSDKQLNGAYRTLASKLQREDAQMLLTAQRAWVAYKEKTCQGAYDATSPGEEAGIDKWTCLDEITKTRLRELQYLESGAGLADFFHAADVVSEYYENGSRNRFIAKLADKALLKDDPNWNLYVAENCKLAVSRFSEEKQDCMARQIFYRY